jgi:hypothetical protein
LNVAKTYNAQEVQLRLAKHIETMIDRVAGDIQDLVKREKIKKSLWATAHEEPGTHEAEAPGQEPHMEPGGHEQFALNPPATPEAATAAPIHGGSGVPPGQLDNPGTPGADAGADPMAGMIMGDGPCPLCQQPEQNCKCLDAMILGKTMTKLPDGSGAMTGLVKNASMGYGSASGGGAPNSLAMSEMCKACGKAHGMEKCSDGLQPHASQDPAKKSEADGRNGDPTKKQPTKPIDGAKMPPESPKKVKGPDDNKVKENGLGKTDVPQAKPPSGKVPGGTSNPPMASTSSKQTLKEEPLDKAVMNPQAQQHMNIDSSKAAAPKPAATSSAQLTHPANMARANTHAAAMAGEFQPKGPVTSGLDLAPKGLTAPPPAVRQGAVPAPKMAGMPKPTMPAVPAKAGGVFGHLFGKSEDEKCVLCNKPEHTGDCN